MADHSNSHSLVWRSRQCCGKYRDNRDGADLHPSKGLLIPGCGECLCCIKNPCCTEQCIMEHSDRVVTLASGRTVQYIHMTLLYKNNGLYSNTRLCWSGYKELLELSNQTVHFQCWMILPILWNKQFSSSIQAISKSTSLVISQSCLFLTTHGSVV